MDRYDGPFDPAFHLAQLSRPTLAALGREYMLFGHLLNRAALPAVHMSLGADAREAVAIAEWMGASPIYTRRMQQRMKFAGTDVGTIFKGFQLDVGFPHQYMDVHYHLESAERGYFWLQRCGALLEVEPYGEGAVRSMCHAIEDPTFDATAVATNPRARCRPIHRPPRRPSDRVPHCRWEVFVDPAARPIEQPLLTTRVGASRLAAFAFAPVSSSAVGGRDDYAGDFDADFRLEDLSHRALVGVCQEFLLQNHLLVRALMMEVADRGGEELAARIGTAQFIGAGAVAAGRVQRAVGISGSGVAPIVKMLQLHPAFVPEYVRLGAAVDGADRGRVWIEDCAALDESDRFGWVPLLADGATAALEAVVQALDPRARCLATSRPYARLAWDVVVDGAAEPAEVPAPAAMVVATGTARFTFAPDGPAGGR